METEIHYNTQSRTTIENRRDSWEEIWLPNNENHMKFSTTENSITNVDSPLVNDDIQMFNMLLEMDINFISEKFDLDNFPVPIFDQGPLILLDCEICLESKTLPRRVCCNLACCKECMSAYITAHINEARVHFSCPNQMCNKVIERNEILFYLDKDMINKYEKFLLDANKETLRKTCPRCSFIEEITEEQYKLERQNLKLSKGIKVACIKCDLEWCFLCHAPYHVDLTCKQFNKGSKQLKQWAAEKQNGQQNAQKCPKCKIYIQRVSGCDHMTCSRCETEFCYLCGEKFRGLRFLGNHSSRLSIFGCKYRFQPDNPALRKFARGGLFAAKVSAVPVIAAGAVAAAAIALPVGSVALTGYLFYKLHKNMKSKRMLKQRILLNKQMRDLYNAGIISIEHPWRSSENEYNITVPSSTIASSSLEYDKTTAVVADQCLSFSSLSELDGNLSVSSFDAVTVTVL